MLKSKTVRFDNTKSKLHFIVYPDIDVISIKCIVVIIIAIAVSSCSSAKQSGRINYSEIPEFTSSDSLLVWPLPIITDARITSKYGSRKDPLSGRSSFHTGVDLDGSAGTPVHAAARGIVQYSGERSGYGLVIILDHGGGLTTYYAHCSKLLCKMGAKVDRGQVIALIGSTGRVTGSHLHFETRKFGRAFDPFAILPKLKPVSQ